MCGIAGRVTFDGAVGDIRLLQRMCGTIAHRGPDDEGLHVAPHIALGQRRLAVIDLSPAAVAPLSNEDGTIWVTLNGEIYNFRELRAGLLERGHVFRTSTDTEVLVHLYEEHGADCVQHLRGMFAFAIWDAPRRRLFAARDRLGKKPFVYARTSRALVFGSEIKAVTADPDVSIEPDHLAIDRYLTLQYVPSPRTAFAGIHKLPPAHWLLCEASGAVTTGCYWRLPDRAASSRSADPRDVEQELVDRLRECVRARLVADVPLGAFLSGGIDSASVVALMAEAGGRVRTFSIGFDEASHDELPFARLVADRFGTDHHEFVVRADAADVLPRLVHHYNEPFADPSAVPTYYVSKITREHVTVALSGDGGDENFAGYHNYAEVLAWGRRTTPPWRLAGALGRGVAASIDRLPYQDGLDRASRAVTMLTGTVADQFGLQGSIFKPREKTEAYSREFRGLIAAAGAGDPQTAPEDVTDDALDWMMRQDLSRYLPDCLMTKVDIASMAHGLEVRSPLLDHTFVEFAARIPSSWKFDGTKGKLVFRRALAPLLPPEVLERRKAGFGLPVARWLAGPLNGLLRETVLGDRARRRGLFQPAFVRRMVEAHTEGRRDWSHRLWALLFLELWFREFID
jgi:asparagine synthase (glutamine-hydrolysing)